jgi:hypothetical protein
MDFNKRNLYFLVMISLIFMATVAGNSLVDGNNHTNHDSEYLLNPKTSGEILIDKVYTFSVDAPYINLTNLLFQAKCNYYIYIQIVSPHECTVRINLKDPEGDKYDLFCKYMSQSDGISEVPFGTTLTGEHDISINLVTSYNLNIHVRIERGVNCLYDVLSPTQLGNLIQYDVIKFQDSSIQIDHALLETDAVYKFYFSRVSAISIEYDNNVSYSYSLLDDQGTSFSINWKNDQLEGISGVSMYEFGTASAGIYTTNLSINCNVNQVNIAYAIVFDQLIGGAIENTTTPGDGNSFSDIASLPEEWVIGTAILIGCTMAILTVLLVNNRKKNTLSLNLKEK